MTTRQEEEIRPSEFHNRFSKSETFEISSKSDAVNSLKLRSGGSWSSRDFNKLILCPGRHRKFRLRLFCFRLATVVWCYCKSCRL